MVSKSWVKKGRRRLQKIYVIWYSFCALGESFARTFEHKQHLFPRSWSRSTSFPFTLFFLRRESFVFLFQTIKNDWVLRRFFERYITILSVSVDIKGDFFFQLVSEFFRLYSKFKSFFSEESKIPWQHLNTVYAPIYS